MNEVKMKKIIKVELDTPVPADAKFIKFETVIRKVRPPEGGQYTKEVELAYYEVPVTNEIK